MADLTMATEGPCAGHLCDNCKICQRGRCCRNDNPHYKLPELGEWDGPIFGELGVLRQDGERVECHCCGQWYKGLGTHIWAKHNLLADEYRSIFGLGYNRSLTSEEVSRRASENAKWQIANNPVVAANFAAACALRDAATPEQKQAWRDRGKERLESKRNIQKAFTQSQQRTGEWFITHGKTSANATLDWNRVREIRFRYQNGESNRSLRSAYSVSERTIRDIVNGKSWQEVAVNG